ncbi:Serine/threonine-protein phosphatase 5 [Picochlorum sp. SENEW3]|nr:Serine/threonine-protein phosphatase 5 [Picochlorum sp. SENEW3]WPT17306.1 Serine/threonine-protein phosphatase 5 [Picochlorum sp. SENEW3]
MEHQNGSIVTEGMKEEAESIKNEANAYFKEKHYNEAVEGYTKAIGLDPSNPVYWSNRAFAHIRIEEYGAAIQDATRAIELDPKYAKAYYRRGDAQFALSHFKDSVSNFRCAARLNPRDPDLRRKLQEAERELKRVRFEAAVALPEDTTSALNTIVLEDIFVEESYNGPVMEKNEAGEYVVTEAFVHEMIKEFREQRKIHRRFSMQIILEAYERLRELPSLVDVDVPEGTHITVCGDTHGQFYDLLKIFELNGMPSASNPYVFNGDFVDRGSFSFEVIMTLLAFKAWDTNCMHLTRGNHESKSMNTIYGFYGEVKEKMGQSSIEIFRELFCAMPLAYVLRKTVMVVHGGVPTGDTGCDLASLRKIDRVREPPDAGPMCECLWNDPQDEPGVSPSKRGVGYAFGPDVTKRYLQQNGLSLLVRSHEVKDAGYELAHDGFCCTIFSAPNYCDQMGNKGAFIRFNGEDMVPHFTQFEASPHPPVRAMKYASGMFGMM